MAELTKQDIKEVFIEALEPFALAIQKDFEKIDGKFEKIDGKFEKIDGKFEKIDGKFEKIDKQFILIDKRFDTLKDEIVEENNKNINKFLTEADKISKKLDTLMQENAMHNYAHKRIDDTLEIHDKKIKILETKYA